MSEEIIKELEETQEYLERQIKLRDELIIKLIAEAEPLCDECLLKDVCSGGKFETCAYGLLAAMQKAKADERTPENYITTTRS